MIERYQFDIPIIAASAVTAIGLLALWSLATTPIKPTDCTPTKADLAPFAFPRTRFPLPVMFSPMDEAEPS